MPSPATSKPNACCARTAWQAALLGSVLASCASTPSEPPPTAKAPAKAQAQAQAAAPAKAPAAAPAKAPAAAPQAAAPQAAAKPAAPGKTAAVEKPKVEAEQGAKLEGFISSQLIARWIGGDKDLDWTNLVSVDWSDPRHAWISAHVVTRISADLNGRSSNSVFNGLSDLHDQAVDFKLYDAYVDITPPEGLGRLRLGRQFEFETPLITQYDGLDFRTSPTGDSEFTAGFYGGVPVRLYQGTSERRSLFGVFAEERPWKGGRARIDWMHVEDDTLVESGNGIFGLSAWQRFEGGWSAEAQYTRLEDQDRDLRLRGQWTSAQSGFTASATYYQLFQMLNELPQGIDPYTSILTALYPYQQYELALSSEITDHLSLDLAGDARRVRDSADLGEFNRDWERYRATAVLHDALLANLDVSVSADFWDGDGRDISTWGADLSYDTQADWKFGAGSYYSLYKYDIFQNSERDDVRTWYGRANWKLNKSLSLELCYDYEDDNLNKYNVLRGGALWRF